MGLGFYFLTQNVWNFRISGFTSWPKMCEVLGINNCQSLANPAYSTSNLEINTAEFHLICGTWSCNNFCIGYQNNGVRSCCQIWKVSLLKNFVREIPMSFILKEISMSIFYFDQILHKKTKTEVEFALKMELMDVKMCVYLKNFFGYWFDFYQ